jgi:hypothetical protein
LIDKKLKHNLWNDLAFMLKKGNLNAGLPQRAITSPLRIFLGGFFLSHDKAKP